MGGYVYNKSREDSVLDKILKTKKSMITTIVVLAVISVLFFILIIVSFTPSKGQKGMVTLEASDLLISESIMDSVDFDSLSFEGFSVISE